MAAEKKLHSIPLTGFWADVGNIYCRMFYPIVGQPKDFLIGTALYLKSISHKDASVLKSGSDIIGNVLIDPTAKIGSGCKIGPDVTIGPGVVVGDNVRLSKCVLLKDCHIKDVILMNSF